MKADTSLIAEVKRVYVCVPDDTDYIRITGSSGSEGRSPGGNRIFYIPWKGSVTLHADLTPLAVQRGCSWKNWSYFGYDVMTNYSPDATVTKEQSGS